MVDAASAADAAHDGALHHAYGARADHMAYEAERTYSVAARRFNEYAASVTA
jgi:hypothetical protein